jgi:hypothetical protein
LKTLDMETNMTHFQLSSEQTERASALVTPALSFVLEHTFGLGTALVHYHWHDGAAQDVIDELGTYQNEDGGFGRNLEVDIKSSASNPFAARLAMGILLSLRDRPSSPLIAELEIWLRDNQHADGDWHFSDDVYKGELPPWFAAWSFPGLNPACCIAGLANRLGIASPDMLDRVERLFAEKSSLDEASTGEFYNVLPYVEYLGGVDVPDREEWLDAVAGNITKTVDEDRYADAAHFLDHAMGGGPDLVKRIPNATWSRQADRLMSEVEPDGGWPSPYDSAWRPNLTASALTMLARLRDGI